MLRLIIRFLKKFNLLQFFNFVIPVTIYGKKFKVPVFKSLGNDNLDISEIWMCQLLEKLLNFRQGDFLDVGVNIGQTLIKLKSVNADRKYFGFEPNPVCVYYVQQLIKANKFENITLFPVGIAEKTQLIALNFFSDSNTDSSATILTDFRSPQSISRREIIPCFRFDEIDPSYPQDFGIVKIDVEGAELEVLKGIRTMVQNKRPLILIEILPVYNKENAFRIERQLAIEQMMNSLDYRFIRIHKTKDNQLQKLELIGLIGIHDQMEWSDYILCPLELLSGVLN